MQTKHTLLIAWCITVLALSPQCTKKALKTSVVSPERETAQPSSDPARPATDDDSFDEKANVDPQVQQSLNTVYFDFNSYDLSFGEIDKLQKVASMLTKYRNVRILCQGHCDERGSSEYNMGLGDKRAHAVKKWLTAYGISGNRIETTSYGKEMLAVSGCVGDDGCHAKNRRVEWKVLSK